jgi:hypothetical protein
MKAAVNIFLLLSFFILFTTCQKTESPAKICLLSEIKFSYGRNVRITYNDKFQITKIMDYSDTLKTYHTSMIIRYNSQNFFSCIEKYGNNDKITDSVIFEYPDNLIIKSIIYRNTTGPMIPNFYKTYYFNSNGLLSRDSVYIYSIGGSVGRYASGYTQYLYNNKNNVVQIDYYDNPGNGFAYLFGWIYEYANTEMPTNSWINFIWTSYLNPFFADSYIIPLRNNMVTKEKHTPASGDYERSHSYEYDTSENPVKEVVTEPGVSTTITYVYTCE